jgi:hypothetical protein
MKCSYHPEVDSRHICNACKKLLCDECATQIKGKAYCLPCLERGADWVTTVKDFRLPSDSPRRAAIFAVIPGIGAVYNNEYLKAVTYFTVFAALVVMGDTLNAVFGFGAFVFLVFTMFEAYRTAEKNALRRVQPDVPGGEPARSDNSLAGWGVFLILAGVLFLLQNILSFYFLVRMWPAIFILIGGFLVYLSVRGRRRRNGDRHESGSSTEFNKE